MADQTQPGGLFASLKALLATLIAIGHNRLELFSTELQEEIARAASILLWALAALLLAFLAVLLGRRRHPARGPGRVACHGCRADRARRLRRGSGRGARQPQPRDRQAAFVRCDLDRAGQGPRPAVSMSTRLQELGARRRQLVAQSDALRARLSGSTQGLEQVLGIADLGVAAGRYVKGKTAAAVAGHRGRGAHREAAARAARHQLRIDRPLDLQSAATGPVRSPLSSTPSPPARRADGSGGAVQRPSLSRRIHSDHYTTGETT